MAQTRKRGRRTASLIKCKSGNKVKSYSESVVDNWLHENKFSFKYEPSIIIEGVKLSPDWIIYGIKGRMFPTPIVVEYWGLLRKEGRAAWVAERLPKYMERKAYKESLYFGSEFHFIGLFPEQLDDLTKTLASCISLYAMDGEFDDTLILQA